MRIQKKLIAVAATGAAAATFGLVPSAHADSGDGLLSCNNYEICFSRDAANTTYQKHFYYSGSHSGYTFTNVSSGATNQGALTDNAAQVRNRDGSCDVKVVDTKSFAPDDTHTIPNNNTWTNLSSSVINQNNKHERVNC